MRLKINKTYMWRGALMFSAAFFCLALVATSCKKKKNPVGEGALPPGTSMSSAGVDTFQLFTYTIEEDSVVSMDQSFNLLGSYNDPKFGPVEANFYTQFALSEFNLDIDMSSVVVDSVVMAFEYGGYYGTINEQTFEVHEINEELSRDSTYLSSATVGTETQNLILPGFDQFKPDLQTLPIVGDDTLSEPQLRLRLDTNLGEELLTLANNATDNETFTDAFKGLHFKVNNGPQTAGEGSILYLTTSVPESKMTVYFKLDGVENEFDFTVGNSEVDFNHIDMDNSGTEVQQVIDDHTLGQDEFYAQAFISRGKIDIPSLTDLPEDAIIHEATLEIPVNYYQGSDFYTSEAITVSSKIFENDDQRYFINDNVTYNQQRRAYVVDLRKYIQNILKGEVVNSGLIISPRLYATTTERIIFNGPSSLNKKQPKLNVVYTKL
ncbi:MAG: DUF4270 family protein [Brumimicrobium sp.]